MNEVILLKNHKGERTWKILIDGADSSGDTTLERAWLNKMIQIFQVFLSKQADYGPNNIALAGEEGVVTRAQDKIARLKVLGSALRSPNNESIRDSWVDLADYGIIGLLVHDGDWPQPSEPERLPDATLYDRILKLTSTVLWELKDANTGKIITSSKLAALTTALEEIIAGHETHQELQSAGTRGTQTDRSTSKSSTASREPPGPP